MEAKAELIVKNGELFSADLLGNVSWHEAAAVSNGKILAVGTNREIEKYETSDTKIIDVEGVTVLPGLCDSHAHGSYATELICGVQTYNIDPEEGESREQYIGRLLEPVKKFMEKNPEMPAIKAAGWNPAVFQEDPEGLPTKEDLDRICPDKPLLMKSYCHHYLWINTKALELSGIAKEKETPHGYIMYRDNDGEPTGMFQEFPAILDVLNSFEDADYSVEEYEKGILSYQENWAMKTGTTNFFDPILTPNSLSAYRNLAQNGTLKLRVNGALLADPTKPVSQFDEWIKEKGSYDIPGKVKVDTIKFFFDGSGFEMYLNEPFQKDVLVLNGLPEHYRGREIWSLAQAKEAFLYVAKAGFNIHVHSMGDAGVKEALDAFEYVSTQGVDLKKQKHVITHIMLVDDSDMKRMAELGIIAAMQPHWGMYDGFAELYMTPILGAERVYRSYPTGGLLKAGVFCTAGTDFPVIPEYDMMTNIQTGMTRTVPKSSAEYDKYKWYEDCNRQYRMTLEEALKLYTINGAYQISFDDIVGSFEPGKSADFVILDKNLKALSVDEMETARIVQVVVCGETVRGEKE